MEIMRERKQLQPHENKVLLLLGALSTGLALACGQAGVWASHSPARVPPLPSALCPLLWAPPLPARRHV